MMGGQGWVELRVREGEGAQDILVYKLKGMGEAAQTIKFLREFLPSARFLIQPLMH